ncbi:MAG: S41 family peptidase [Lachnospiraceae bacterium]|nr:S41 family peptidase [Lachnospiraceae bacterium]
MEFNTDTSTDSRDYRSVRENYSPYPGPGRDPEKKGKKAFAFACGLLGGLALGIAISLAAITLGKTVFPAVFGPAGAQQAQPALSSGGATTEALTQESAEKLRLLQDMIEENYYYVDDVTQEMLRDGVYKGLVSSLGDPYSEYYNEADMEELEEQLSGYFFGIGAYLTKQEDAAVISGVIRGTPAEESGLMPGDIIMKVDDVRVTYEMSLDEVVAMVRGPEGTVVHLTVYRESEGKDLEFDVTRAQISSETVYSEMLDGDIGLIVVDRFEEVTSGQFKDALEDLKKQGMKALVIDLRYNPGGQVTTVTEIASELLPEGLVFYTEDKSGARTEYTCPGVDFGYPLAVLVNEYSASASEILAGAIQDAEIGTIVGTQTFGKGVVQSVYSLGDGTALKLTVSAYYTRGGQNINGVGITPDVEAEFDADVYQKDGTDTQLEKALEILNKELSE